MCSSRLRENNPSEDPGCPSGWVSLDERGNEPIRFWRHVDAAWQKVDSHLGENLHSVLFSNHTVTFEQIITGLVRDIVTSGLRLILILEDYHFIVHGTSSGCTRWRSNDADKNQHKQGCFHFVSPIEIKS